MKQRYGEVDVSALFITGWYDDLLHEGFKCFGGWRRQARSEKTSRLTKLLVVPWTHSEIGSDGAGWRLHEGPLARVRHLP